MSSQLHLTEPSPWIVRFAPLIRKRGTVLDLACGGGRHALHLAALGYLVEAVDQDEEGLARLVGIPGIATLRADLEGRPWPFQGRRFDAVVATHYLHRPLFPAIREALADGGVLLYETFMEGQEHLGKPRNPHFLLRDGELLEAFADLTAVAFEQGRVEKPWPAVVQRLCAVKGLAVDAIHLPDPSSERGD